MTWIRLATEEDISYVAPRLRQADKEEVWASGSYLPEDALRASYRASEPCFAGVEQDKPVALFGVAPVSSNVGAIWLLGTDAISNKIPISFLRWSRRFLPFLLEPYDMVCNQVHAKNTVHIKWLRWLGFTFINKIERGPYNEQFYEFARLSNV